METFFFGILVVSNGLEIIVNTCCCGFHCISLNAFSIWEEGECVCVYSEWRLEADIKNIVQKKNVILEAMLGF